MALAFGELQAELYQRGFDYLQDDPTGELRARRWLNDAMHRINAMHAWIYLQTAASGAAPLAVTNLARIIRVTTTDTGVNASPLVHRGRLDLGIDDGDITITGTPEFYYLTGETAGSITVNVYPVYTGSITVNYSRADPDMAAATDAPSMPDRFRMAVVDLAVAAALKDKSNYVEAAAAEQSALALVDQMAEWDLMLHGEPARQVIVGGSEDW